MSETIWVRSKWTFDDLQGESVEFKLPLQDGEVQGVGQLVVSRGSNDLLSVDIRTVLSGGTQTEKGTFNFHLNQWAADRLERHPDRAIADFRCFG